MTSPLFLPSTALLFEYGRYWFQKNTKLWNSSTQTSRSRHGGYADIFYTLDCQHFKASQLKAKNVRRKTYPLTGVTQTCQKVWGNTGGKYWDATFTLISTISIITITNIIVSLITIWHTNMINHNKSNTSPYWYVNHIFHVFLFVVKSRYSCMRSGSQGMLFFSFVLTVLIMCFIWTNCS